MIIEIVLAKEMFTTFASQGIERNRIEVLGQIGEVVPKRSW